jgi:PncC family amidohydrolase
MTMKDLLPLAETIAARLKARKETIAIAESSTGGLISAALLAVGGASAYFIGGGIVYTRQAKQLLLSIDDATIAQFRPATEGHALVLGRAARARFNTTWALAETGATGPTGNRYGDPAGHTCFALVGASEKAITLRTGKDDRVENMSLFAAAGLKLLADALA